MSLAILRRVYSLDFINFDNKHSKKVILILSYALLLAILFTFISYPGILYSDSYGRWAMAKGFSEFKFEQNSNWLSVPPQIFMAICYYFTQNIASYTFLQSFLFFLTSFLLIDYVCKGFSAIYILLFSLCPVFYGFSVYHEASVGCIVGINLLILYAFRKDIIDRFNKGSLKYKLFYFINIFFIYFIIFGYRQNAFTIVPVIFLALMYIYIINRNIPFVINQILAIFLSIALINSLPKILGFRSIYDVSSVGFMWETICMLENLQDKQEYRGYLDYLMTESAEGGGVYRKSCRKQYKTKCAWV